MTVSIGNAQSNSKLCILFNKNTEYISVNVANDSMRTAFNIVIEGYETKEKREKAIKDWAKQVNRVAGGPNFYYNFFSIHKPVKISSIKEVKECAETVSVNEFRQKDFEASDQVTEPSVIFIKKLPDGTFLKWEAGLLLRM